MCAQLLGDRATITSGRVLQTTAHGVHSPQSSPNSTEQHSCARDRLVQGGYHECNEWSTDVTAAY
jgi:hypothetical protein